ncbi:hypothetical protein KX729_25930 [Rhizobium sp. XQZ8]|nr:hypothetical protein [Rhizobium populisoli]
MFDASHRGKGFADDLTRLFGTIAGTVHQVARFLRRLVESLTVVVIFVQCCRSLFHGRCLLLSPLGEVIGGRFDRLGACIYASSILRHMAQGLLRLFGRSVKIVACAVQVPRKPDQYDEKRHHSRAWRGLHLCNSLDLSQIITVPLTD